MGVNVVDSLLLYTGHNSGDSFISIHPIKLHNTQEQGEGGKEGRRRNTITICERQWGTYSVVRLKYTCLMGSLKMNFKILAGLLYVYSP